EALEQTKDLTVKPQKAEAHLPELPQVQRLPRVEAQTRVVPVVRVERVRGQPPAFPGAAAGVLAPGSEGVAAPVELETQERPGLDGGHRQHERVVRLVA